MLVSSEADPPLTRELKRGICDWGGIIKARKRAKTSLPNLSCSPWPWAIDTHTPDAWISTIIWTWAAFFSVKKQFLRDRRTLCLIREEWIAWVGHLTILELFALYHPIPTSHPPANILTFLSLCTCCSLRPWEQNQVVGLLHVQHSPDVTNRSNLSIPYLEPSYVSTWGWLFPTRDSSEGMS